ncbi:MAG: hypothetical protein GKR88_09470 [Flavobacteriaceae bacterium]|nr:MAG: hypothetical protein GKR88_09470 [Flavobacteriaceae bacterium]
MITISIFLLFIFSVKISAQKDTISDNGIKAKKQITIAKNTYNPLSPSKAAFYSAIFPGMGQVYNKKYWKVPIVWGALGTSIYFYLDNNKEYKRYRRAFRQREAGLQDEFTLDNGTVLISRNGLINAQRVLRDNRDLSLLVTIILYTLQIVEASVNAHLLQFNTSDRLSFKPVIVPGIMTAGEPIVGMSLKYTF